MFEHLENGMNFPVHWGKNLASPWNCFHFPPLVTEKSTSYHLELGLYFTFSYGLFVFDTIYISILGWQTPPILYDPSDQRHTFASLLVENSAVLCKYDKMKCVLKKSFVPKNDPFSQTWVMHQHRSFLVLIIL